MVAAMCFSRMRHVPVGVLWFFSLLVLSSLPVDTAVAKTGLSPSNATSVCAVRLMSIHFSPGARSFGGLPGFVFTPSEAFIHQPSSVSSYVRAVERDAVAGELHHRVTRERVARGDGLAVGADDVLLRLVERHDADLRLAPGLAEVGRRLPRGGARSCRQRRRPRRRARSRGTCSRCCGRRCARTERGGCSWYATTSSPSRSSPCRARRRSPSPSGEPSGLRP